MKKKGSGRRKNKGGRKRKAGVTRCGCAGVRVYHHHPCVFKFRVSPAFHRVFQHWFGVSDPLVFSNLFPQRLIFSPHPLGFQPSCLSPFMQFHSLPLSHPYGCSHSPFVFSLPLWVFPTPLVFPRLPRGCSHIVLFTNFCVVFHTLVLNKPVVFGALFCF